MSQPVDATATAAWAELQALHDSLEPDLRGWFAADQKRAEAFSFHAGDLYVDLSKNLINAEILDALADLADQVGLTERRDAMYAGEHINVTEDRAVLHTALRLPRDASLVVDGVHNNGRLGRWYGSDRDTVERWWPEELRVGGSLVGDARA